jgi:rhodanese-related sulfurtransferase
MSEIAAKELVLLGYANIWNLADGMVEWEQAGYEIKK